MEMIRTLRKSPTALKIFNECLVARKNRVFEEADENLYYSLPDHIKCDISDFEWDEFNDLALKDLTYFTLELWVNVVVELPVQFIEERLGHKLLHWIDRSWAEQMDLNSYLQEIADLISKSFLIAGTILDCDIDCIEESDYWNGNYTFTFLATLEPSITPQEFFDTIEFPKTVFEELKPKKKKKAEKRKVSQHITDNDFCPVDSCELPF